MVSHTIPELAQDIAQMKANVMVIVNQKNVAFDCHRVSWYMAAYCESIYVHTRHEK